jgi:hypothetical protein
MGGNVESFLFRDEFGEGYQIPRSTILTAAGGETNVQMIRTHTVGSTSRSYEIWNIENNGTLKVWKNTVLQAQPGNYTANYIDDGSFDFVVPLSPGDVIEAECEYLRRVRFTGSLRNILRAYDLVDLALGIAEEGVG